MMTRRWTRTKEETDNEEIGDEVQEEEHQMAGVQWPALTFQADVKWRTTT